MARRVKIPIKGRITLFKIGRLEICWWKDFKVNMYYRKPLTGIVKSSKEA